MSTENSFVRKLVSATLKPEDRHRAAPLSRRGRAQYSLWRRSIAATLRVPLPNSQTSHRESACRESDLRGATKRRQNLLKAITLPATLLGVVALLTSSLGRAGMLIALTVAFLTMVYAYWNSDRLALQAMCARPASENEVPELYRIVRELSVAARHPIPLVYISPTQAPNAFAVGRTPKNSAICCTEGVLRLLDERELRGVIAHELSHIHKRDALVSSTVGALAGAVLSLLSLVWMTPLGRSDEEGGSTLAAALLVIFMGGPLAASLIRLAVSRSCESKADVSGALLTGDPLALASALRKLDKGAKLLPLPPEPRLQVRGHMMIVSPFRESSVSRLFSTHTPTQERIARLERMAGRQT